MEKWMNLGIKPIIDEFPSVGDILESYDIGCVPCSLGTCLLKDVVDIHNLDPVIEQEMMNRIAAVIYPSQNIVVPLKEREVEASNKITYSPPMRDLVTEHTWIMRVIRLLPSIADIVDPNTEEGKCDCSIVVDFIRQYADKFHHAKEEDILFKFFENGIDIIDVMLADHVTGRNFVNGIVEASNSGDRIALKTNMDGYGALLTQHIKKEDEILYPWMDRQLSDRDVGILYSKFSQVDNERLGLQEKYEKIVIDLENKFS